MLPTYALCTQQSDLPNGKEFLYLVGPRRDGGIGRRSGLKIHRGQPLESSSLSPGTSYTQYVRLQ